MDQVMASLVDQVEAARVIGVLPRTLEGWRLRGYGPRFVRISPRCVRYRLKDIEKWLSKQVVEPDAGDMAEEDQS
jgi:hypothetical protein